VIRIFEVTDNHGDIATVEIHRDDSATISVEDGDSHLNVALSPGEARALRKALDRHVPELVEAATAEPEESVLDPERVEALLLAAEVAKDLRGEAGPFGGGAVTAETVVGLALFLMGQINAPAA